MATTMFIVNFIKQNGEVVYHYASPRKRTILLTLQGERKIKTPFKNGYLCHLKVNYAPRYYNEGTYDNLKDAVYAYKAFTEQSLIDDFAEYR